MILILAALTDSFTLASVAVSSTSSVSVVCHRARVEVGSEYVVRENTTDSPTNARIARLLAIGTVDIFDSPLRRCFRGCSIPPSSTLVQRIAQTCDEVHLSQPGLPRDPLVPHRRMPGDDGKHDGRLGNILALDGIRQIGVRVPGADVVVFEILDRRESGHARLDERNMVGASDALDDVPPDAEVRERFEPGVRGASSARQSTRGAR